MKDILVYVRFDDNFHLLANKDDNAHYLARFKDSKPILLHRWHAPINHDDSGNPIGVVMSERYAIDNGLDYEFIGRK